MLQLWKRALDHLPDDFEIEPEVIVHDSVPQPGDLRPWDPLVALLEFRRQPAYRLPDHLQVTHYRIDRLLILQKLSTLEPGNVALNPSKGMVMSSSRMSASRSGIDQLRLDPLPERRLDRAPRDQVHPFPEELLQAFR